MSINLNVELKVTVSSQICLKVWVHFTGYGEIKYDRYGIKCMRHYLVRIHNMHNKLVQEYFPKKNVWVPIFGPQKNLSDGIKPASFPCWPTCFTPIVSRSLSTHWLLITPFNCSGYCCSLTPPFHVFVICCVLLFSTCSKRNQ